MADLFSNKTGLDYVSTLHKESCNEVLVLQQRRMELSVSLSSTGVELATARMPETHAILIASAVGRV